MSQNFEKSADSKTNWQAVEQGSATAQDIDAIYNSIWNARSAKAGADLTSLERMQYERQSSAGPGSTNTELSNCHRNSSCSEKHLPPVEVVTDKQPLPPPSRLDDQNLPEKNSDGCPRGNSGELPVDGIKGAGDSAYSGITINAVNAFIGGPGFDRGQHAPRFFEASASFNSLPNYDVWSRGIHAKDFGFQKMNFDYQGNNFAESFQSGDLFKPNGFGMSRLDKALNFAESTDSVRNPDLQGLEKRTQKVCYPDGSSRVVLRNDQGEIVAVVNPDGSRLERCQAEPGKGHTWQAFGRHGTPITADSFRGEVQMTADGTFRVIKVYPVPQTYEQKADGSYRHAYKNGVRKQWSQPEQSMAVLYPDGKRRTIQYAADGDGILQEKKVTNI